MFTLFSVSETTFPLQKRRKTGGERNNDCRYRPGIPFVLPSSTSCQKRKRRSQRHVSVMSAARGRRGHAPASFWVNAWCTIILTRQRNGWGCDLKRTGNPSVIQPINQRPVCDYGRLCSCDKHLKDAMFTAAFSSFSLASSSAVFLQLISLLFTSPSVPPPSASSPRFVCPWKTLFCVPVHTTEEFRFKPDIIWSGSE